MSGASRVWDEPRWKIERERVGEYTDDALRARYRVLDEATIAELMALPALFAYEKPVDRPARLGRITQIATRGLFVRIQYVFLEGVPPIPAAQFLELASDLDIDSGWEVHRTHWAVKDVDLFEVLRNVGLNPVELARKFSGGVAPVVQPTLSVSSLAVDRALADAEQLIETRGPTSGVDRVHTALQGFMIELCRNEG